MNRGGEPQEEAIRRILLEEARERIERYGPKDRPTGLSFDEWNVWHAWYREPGVAEGLHAAAMLNMLVREGHRLGVTIGAYFEPVNEGAIRIEHDSSWLTPAGSVHELFRAHHGNEALAIDAPGDDDDVDAAASLDREKGELVVTLMNRSPDGEAAIEFAVKGARVSKAEGVLLSAPDFFPGSTFDRQDLPVAADGSTVAAKLQKHSVALIRVACG